jgi:hypothetical protein
MRDMMSELSSCIKSTIIMLLVCVSPLIYAVNFKQIPDETVHYNQKQKETMAYVNQAIAYYQKHGLEKSIDAFSQSKQSKQGQHYIYIVDAKGNILAHGYNLDKKHNLSNMKTIDGENIVKVLFNLAKHANGGWYIMVWYNPENHERQLKTLYVKKLPCLDKQCKPMIIGSGYY